MTQSLPFLQLIDVGIAPIYSIEAYGLTISPPLSLRTTVSLDVWTPGEPLLRETTTIDNITI
jgi:hypothetical protein